MAVKKKRIKPCPCGAAVNQNEYPTHDGTCVQPKGEFHWEIWCEDQKCGFSARAWGKDDSAVIRAWNRREKVPAFGTLVVLNSSSERRWWGTGGRSLADLPLGIYAHQQAGMVSIRADALQTEARRLKYRLSEWPMQTDLGAQVAATAKVLEEMAAGTRGAAPPGECEERCKRLHPHCQLRLARAVAPDHLWHWSVVMPDGHLFDYKGSMTLEEAVASMASAGAASLQSADARWREMHPTVQIQIPENKS